VMIVDDHAVVRDDLRAPMAQQAELEVRGLAAYGIEALQMARECQPDVVLMDLDMRWMGGIEAGVHARERRSTCQ
jgi:DNA-binding NarL/FixJ family response regulator